MEPNLKLVIPFKEFQDKIMTLINDLKFPEVKEPSEFPTLENYVKQWIEQVENILKVSFNIQNNKIDKEFYSVHPGHTYLIKQVDDKNLSKAIEIQIKKIESKIEWLRYNLKIIEFSDAIIDPKFDYESAKKLTTGEKLNLLLIKAYELREFGSAPVQEILENNGVVFKQLHEPMTIAKTLDEKGLANAEPDTFGNWHISLTVDGELFVEENLIVKSKNNMKEKSGKVFVSHATKDKDIASKFCDLILGNALNIQSKDIFNTSHQGTKPKTGEDFKSRIKNELINAKVVLQFISKAYKQSEACLNEMGAAWVLSDNVKPLIVEKGEYEVGFIHSSTQQAQLHSEEHLLRLTDELKEEGVYEGIVKNEVLVRKVKEFIKWLEEYDGNVNSNTAVKTQAKGESVSPEYENAIKVIATYLKSKNLTHITFQGLKENVNSKYTEQFVLELIERYPTKLTRAKLQGEFGIKILPPSINDI